MSWEPLLCVADLCVACSMSIWLVSGGMQLSLAAVGQV